MDRKARQLSEYLIGAVASCIVAFVLVYAATPGLIKYLVSKNMTVPDIMKQGKPMIARPGGIVIIIGIVSAQTILYVLLQNVSILAIMITSILAFAIGFIDDRRVMGGWFKPVALAAAAAPILILGAYDTNLAFPIFGEVKIPLLYIGIVVAMISITGNTMNSIDVMNGAVSGFMVIAGFSLSVALFIVESFSILPNYDIAVASLPLGFVALAFYKYHKIPCKIFPGDSGALAFGATYGAIAIVGQVEVIAAIAILPAIFNSFLFLSSVKRIVEHRQIKTKAVEITDDLKLKSTKNLNAPVTLVRIIVSKTAMTEGQIVSVIFKLALFSGILAVISAILTVMV